MKIKENNLWNKDWITKFAMEDRYNQKHNMGFRK